MTRVSVSDYEWLVERLKTAETKAGKLQHEIKVLRRRLRRRGRKKHGHKR